MAYSQIFERVIKHHFLVEGGEVDNPYDPGGYTKYGIAQRYNSDVDVRGLTEETAKALYYERYWKPLGLDAISDERVAAEMFDQGAGPNGISVAIKIAQGALNLLRVSVKVDGAMGPITAAALNGYPHIDALVKLMNCLQFTHFLVGSANVEEVIQMARERLPQLKEFMRGWLKRIDAST